MSEPLSYASAGVDLDAADAAVEAIRTHVERTRRPEVLEGIGGFSGLFQLDTTGFDDPVLVTATDGVGTKLELARRWGGHRTVGIDLVAMVVDDLVTCGAEPLVFLDYVAVERLDVTLLEQVVAGIADGCVTAGCALVGGETAEHPGVMPTGSYDLAGFGVGVVERSALLGPHRIESGDALVALASSGPHANGYSLIRRILEERTVEEELRAALLEPTRIYAPACLKLTRAGLAHAFCHVTGGGLPGNLPRILPQGLAAHVDTATWDVPRVFRTLGDWGRVPRDEQWRVFNMGVGMVAATGDGPAAVELLRAAGHEAWVCGEVTAGTGVDLR